MRYLVKLLKNRFIVGYSLTGDNNGYDYSNADYSNADYSNAVANNGYFGSKDSYVNSGSFYNNRDTGHKLSNHVGSHSLINGGNQGSIGSDIGNGYKYPVNEQADDYSGYLKTYENPDSDSHSLSSHATSVPFKGYSGSNNHAETSFTAYSGGSVHKDSDFGQYAAGSSSNGQRVAPYPGYARPLMLDNYSDSDVRAQGYHGSSGGSSISESEHAYFPYPSAGPAGEYPFGKQKDGPYGSSKGGNKYNDIHSVPSETRYTRGNAGHSAHNHGTSSPYLPGYSSKTHGSGVYYSAGKPYKYGHKYSARHVPNSGGTYLTRERDAGHYASYGKGGAKFIIIKDGRRSYASVYPDQSAHVGGTGGGYRSKSGAFVNAAGYSANFDGYGGNHDDVGLTIPRRYRTGGGPMLLQKTVYS